MPQFLATIYAPDLDWTAPEQAEMGPKYAAFGHAAAAVIRGGAALYPTSTGRTVRVTGEDVVVSDGPYAETKEVLAGYYVFECVDLDEAVAWAARIPGAVDGAVEVRPIIPNPA